MKQDCRVGMCGLSALVLVPMLAVCSAWAEEDCGCNEPQFPEASALLAAQGYPSDRYEVTMVWNEVSPADSRTLVGGYHVVDKATADTFDLYTDCAGKLLDGEALTELRIPAKNWQFRRGGVPAETHVAGKRAPSMVKAIARVDVRPRVRVELSELDLTPILAEDEERRAEKTPPRMGVFRELPDPITAPPAADWNDAADGRHVWSAAIHSRGAKGIRVHFSQLTIPADVQVCIFNGADPTEIYVLNPYDDQRTDFWAPTCFGKLVVISCAAEREANLGQLQFRIDRIGHVYKGFDAFALTSPAGRCNLDVACYPDWSEAARGVAGYGYISSVGILRCTGTLITDTDPGSQVLYFLTANHCIRNQSGALNSEFYWLYQTPACNGAPPSPSSCPRSTAADYLAGSGGDGYTGGGNDFTLMRLREGPEIELTYVGWSTLRHPVGTAIRTIHHPWGDYKRYSEGHTAATPYDPAYYEVRYSAGTTEPGSSGCPLFVAGTRQIIGQLWGGTAGCGIYINDPDYYGRFDLTFPVVAQYLDPVSPATDVSFDAATVEVVEGDEGQQGIALTVRLDRLPGARATVTYSVMGGTAESGTDYAEFASGTLEFEGTLEPTATISIQIFGDSVPESDETIVVALSNPTECALGTSASTTITIIDDDTDDDGDGLSNYEEINGIYGYFTDPGNADTDGDGYTDYDEVMRKYGVPMDPTEFEVLPAISVPVFLERERE